MASVCASHGNPLSTPSKYAETPHLRSKFSHLSFSSGPPVRSVAPHPPLTSIIPVPTETLQRANFYPISLPHYTSLSLLLWTPPHLPSARFLTYRHPFAIGQPKFTWSADSYITCYPFMHGLFIALMMEAVRTSETSVNFNVTTWPYIPEDSKLHSHHHENLNSHKMVWCCIRLDYSV
jgi:hypothetical protein